MTNKKTTPEVQEELKGTQSEVANTTSEVTNSAFGDENVFASKSREELLTLLAKLIETEPVESLRRTVEDIKIAFYKRFHAEMDVLKRNFTPTEECPEFTPPTDEMEKQLKELIDAYRKKRDAHLSQSEAVKEDNLKIKLQIIEELKALTPDDSINDSFKKYRELQQRWRESGQVPQNAVKDLWERYNLHSENFYNHVKINKELRDLDFKKNYEAKIELCEAAEALSLEEMVVEAFRSLQNLHDKWRETGPVALEHKEVLWERFKEASSRINKSHQDYFEKIKEEQIANFKLKEELCLQVEELLNNSYESRKEWTKSSDKLLEIQKMWKSIGFAPKKDNAKIYERFRAACDKFFENKRRFFASLNDGMESNLQRKIELCLAAEAIQESEDWKKSTEELISLQAQWKETGAVSRRHSDAIWKRFRAACDKFFERKSAALTSNTEGQEENLKAKEALLAQMQQANTADMTFDKIKEYQRKWSDIGFVPAASKQELQKRYKEVVDNLFNAIRGDVKERSINKFKERISTIKSGGNQTMRGERDKLTAKIKQVESEITLLENNIGFFAKSKGAEALIAEVEKKIARAKEEISSLQAKVKIVDLEQRAATNNQEQE